eukprot:jgi/Mesen1/8637/ME000500S08111
MASAILHNVLSQATSVGTLDRTVSLQSSFKGSCVAVAPARREIGNAGRSLTISCKKTDLTSTDAQVSRRSFFAAAAAVSPILFASRALAILEADDDDALLEKVKKGRKDKIQRRTNLGSYKGDAAAIQKAVYKLSKTGKAIDDGDFASATNLLSNTEWLDEVKSALTNVTSGDAEQSAASDFTSAIGSLQAAVLKDDVEKAKSAFVSSASALETIVQLTGLTEEILGL